MEDQLDKAFNEIIGIIIIAKMLEYIEIDQIIEEHTRYIWS